LFQYGPYFEKKLLQLGSFYQ